jgi:hypothetical protein
MKNIFIASTPFPILIFYSIALIYHPMEENILFIVSDFAESLKLANAISQQKQSPFSNVYCLPGGYGRRTRLPGRFLNWIIKAKNVLTIVNFVKKNQIKNVYSGNDADAEGQAMFYLVKKKNQYAQCIFVEEGASAYASSPLREKKKFLKKLLAKIFYGWWWKEVRLGGTSPWVDKIMVRFPEFLRPELRDKEIIIIKREDFIGLKNNSLFINCVRELNIAEKELNQINILFVLPHSDFFIAGERYKELIKEILKLAQGYELKVAVKYHPREPLGDFFGVRGKEIMILPKSLPLELFYLFSPDSLKFVIGDVSSALLTARWLLNNNVRVISIAPMLNYYDRSLFEVFKKQKIELLDDLNSLFKV